MGREPGVAWSGGGRTRVKSDVSFDTFPGRSSGETFRIAFEGLGQILIQFSEGPSVSSHTHAR